MGIICSARDDVNEGEKPGTLSSAAASAACPKTGETKPRAENMTGTIGIID
jgi:hypothetical protein